MKQDEKVNICFVGRTVSPHDTRVWQEVQTLTSPQFEVDVIVKRIPGEKRTDRSNNITHHRLYEVERGKMSFSQYLKDSFVFLILSMFQLFRITIGKRVHIIVVHTLPEFLVFAAVFHKLSGTKVVLDARDLSVDLMCSRWTGKKAAVLLPVLRFIERISCALSNTVLVASEGFKENLEKRGLPANKIVMLLNTADPLVFKPDHDRVFHKIDHYPRIMYHGTVAERFGVIVAVRAIAELKKDITDPFFDIYGYYDLEYRKQIEKEIVSLRLSDNIRLNKPKNIDEIYEIIKTMDIGLVSYLDNKFMNTALSTKTFEYVASGLPVVASRLRCTQRIFNENCIAYASAGNHLDFAEKIRSLCLDPVIRKSYSENALEAYKSVSGEEMARRFTDVVEKLTGKKYSL